MFKSSYFLYLLNKLKYIFINTLVFIFNSKNYKKFKSRQKECFWCKRTHMKQSYFCSKTCNKIYDRDKYQVFKKNNRCKKHKFQKLTFKNECWSCYKHDYIKSIRFDRLGRSLSLRLQGFKTIPTFRTSESSWNGDKIAFEQYLLDKKVKWFVYVKFYENRRGKILPLVAGLSASSKINAGGSDLNFSLSTKDGKARQFLKLNKEDWYYYKIMIKKCNSTQEAYRLESKILEKYNLFSS